MIRFIAWLYWSIAALLCWIRRRHHYGDRLDVIAGGRRIRPIFQCPACKRVKLTSQLKTMLSSVPNGYTDFYKRYCL